MLWLAKTQHQLQFGANYKLSEEFLWLISYFKALKTISLFEWYICLAISSLSFQFLITFAIQFHMPLNLFIFFFFIFKFQIILFDHSISPSISLLFDHSISFNCKDFFINSNGTPCLSWASWRCVIIVIV